MIRDIRLEAQLISAGHSLSLIWTESKTNFTYSLNFVYSSYLTNLRIRYLVILIDSTSLKKDYMEHRFTASLVWSNVTSASIYLPYSLSFAFQNFVFGLSQIAFKIYSDPSFSFTLQKNAGSTIIMDIRYLGTYSPGFGMVFSYVVFPLVICSSPAFPYFNTTDGICYSRCPRLQYLGTARLCSSCRFDCLTCYN